MAVVHRVHAVPLYDLHTWRTHWWWDYQTSLGCLGFFRGWNPTQLSWDYVINHYKDPYELISIMDVKSQEGFCRGSFCISSTSRFQLSRKRMLNVPWKRCMRNVFWWKPRNAMTFIMKPRCFFFMFFFASWGFWKIFRKEVGLKQPTPVFSPWDTWTSRAGSDSGMTCCLPKTCHVTCATMETDHLPGRLCKRWSNSNGFGCFQRAIASTLAGTVFFF